MSARRAAFRRVSFAYILGLVGAIAAGWSFRGAHPLAVAAIADAVGTVIIFAFSRLYDNSSLYDPYWSVAPIVIAAWLWFVGDPVVTRAVVVAALVCAWGVRLTWNWARGWSGLDHEDWRYVDLRAKHGRRYWLVSFAGIHFFPTALVFAGCLSLYPALVVGGAPLGWLDLVAALVTGGAIALQGVADNQLMRFRATKAHGERLKSGVWAYLEYPNYVGEMGLWWGLWLFGMAAAPACWWTVVGPASITALFVFVSIPLKRQRLQEIRE